MRDHGGNIDQARALYGGADWIDLSTGINPVAYPLPALSAHAWTALPTGADQRRFALQAGRACRTDAPVLALPGAQAGIQLYPHLDRPGQARVLMPTYNEHAACLTAAGWSVQGVSTLSALEGADLAVVVNPNNPDGRRYAPEELLALSQHVGRLIVDESFVDPVPDLSVAAHAGARLLVLRSFGKFWGLAGLRLGWVFADAATIAQLSARAGPWPVSGIALEIGSGALADSDWRAATIARLVQDASRLDALAIGAGWSLVGGTPLFRTYKVPDAAQSQAQLARAGIWTRIFPGLLGWIRLGLPGNSAAWGRLAAAI